MGDICLMNLDCRAGRGYIDRNDFIVFTWFTMEEIKPGLLQQNAYLHSAHCDVIEPLVDQLESSLLDLGQVTQYPFRASEGMNKRSLFNRTQRILHCFYFFNYNFLKRLHFRSICLWSHNCGRLFFDCWQNLN